jgi:hypothetical protein
MADDNDTHAAAVALQLTQPEFNPRDEKRTEKNTSPIKYNSKSSSMQNEKKLKTKKETTNSLGCASPEQFRAVPASATPLRALGDGLSA